VTFCVAGLQKLANPAFFRASDPASIQAQLAGAARRSPIHSLIAPLAHVAVPLGILIAFAELAVGLGTLLGLWTRLAATGGAVLAFLLFLTVSFHSRPYYTGSDIVFTFAWLPLVVAGAGGVLSADGLLAELVRRRQGADPAVIVPVPFNAVRQVCGAYEDGRCSLRRGAPCEPGPCPWLAPPRLSAGRRAAAQEIDRRTFAAQGALAGVAAGVAVLAGGLAAAAGRLVGGSSSPSSARKLGTATGTAPTTSTSVATPGAAPSTSAPGATTAPAQPSGTKIGPASAVPVGEAAQFSDPTTGDPSLVVQPKAGTFVAFDAVCPHAGCIVQYDPQGKQFVCPCHGSQFNGRTGAVEVGPAVTGLTAIGITEGPDGQLYVT
jgi:thiosulfate dehydrogenase [quinone] large subunit